MPELTPHRADQGLGLVQFEGKHHASLRLGRGPRSDGRWIDPLAQQHRSEPQPPLALDVHLLDVVPIQPVTHEFLVGAILTPLDEPATGRIDPGTGSHPDQVDAHIGRLYLGDGVSVHRTLPVSEQ